MTPIAEFIARHVPRPLRLIALVATYCALATGVLLASRSEFGRIIYVDVRAGNHGP